jgi:hypothetical protein
MQIDVEGEQKYNFGLFHPSSERPVMYSPYFKTIDIPLKLGRLLAEQLGLAFMDPYIPQTPNPTKVKRNFQLIQGGLDGGEDLFKKKE